MSGVTYQNATRFLIFTVLFGVRSTGTDCGSITLSICSSSTSDISEARNNHGIIMEVYTVTYNNTVSADSVLYDCESLEFKLKQVVRMFEYRSRHASYTTHTRISGTVLKASSLSNEQSLVPG